MKTLIILCATAALAGCSSVPGRFDNRLTTTLDGSRAFVTSLYGPIGLTAELSAADAAELRRIRNGAAEAQNHPKEKLK
ncbi:MAG TPA: hypothetical protein VEB22_04295 [Phycisphaerales bacterium]|nr:hypothetical protein [Phycisphaerales bacterium]